MLSPTPAGAVATFSEFFSLFATVGELTLEGFIGTNGRYVPAKVDPFTHQQFKAFVETSAQWSSNFGIRSLSFKTCDFVGRIFPMFISRFPRIEDVLRTIAFTVENNDCRVWDAQNMLLREVGDRIGTLKINMWDNTKDESINHPNKIDLSHCCFLTTLEVSMRSERRSLPSSSWQFSSFLNTLATLDPTTSPLCHVKCTIANNRYYPYSTFVASDTTLDMSWRELDGMLSRFKELETVVVDMVVGGQLSLALLDLPGRMASIKYSMPLIGKTGRLKVTGLERCKRLMTGGR